MPRPARGCGRWRTSGPPRLGWDGLGVLREDRQAVTRHLDAVLALPMIDVTAIRARGFHVALDCVRGAGASAIPRCSSGWDAG